MTSGQIPTDGGDAIRPAETDDTRPSTDDRSDSLVGSTADSPVPDAESNPNPTPGETPSESDAQTAPAASGTQPEQSPETPATSPDAGSLVPDASASAPASADTPDAAPVEVEQERPEPPDSSTAAEAGVPESLPTAEVGAGESPAGGASPPETSADEAPPRRRVRLNPTVTPEQARAVPTYGESTGARPSPPPRATSSRGRGSQGERKARKPAPTRAEEASPADDLTPRPADAAESIGEDAEAVASGSTEAGTVAAAASESQPVRVELPPDDVELDASLSAALASALEGEETAEGQVAETSQQDSEQPPPPPLEELEKGTRLTCPVQSLDRDHVFLDAGYRVPIVVPRRQFVGSRRPEVGQKLEVVVDHYDEEEGLVLANLPQGHHRLGGDWSAAQVGHIVDCVVRKVVKGGLEVEVGGLRGFLPASQVDQRYVADLESFVGQKLRVQIIESNPRKRNLVVSRRAYLELERQEAEKRIWETLEVGQTLTGTVRAIKDYGAFVDIGGVDGFLHIGEISWNRIAHPSEVLSEGQQVEVKVLSLDPERKRIGLGMKQLVQNPWADVAERYHAGTTVSGKVTRLTDFGAFVELEPGVEGLVHISELDHRHVRKVGDVLSVGQETEFEILEVDPSRKRISLSRKALIEAPPAEEPTDTSRDQRSAVKPPPRKALKGGIGGGAQSTGSGLFGNPSDYGS